MWDAPTSTVPGPGTEGARYHSTPPRSPWPWVHSPRRSLSTVNTGHWSETSGASLLESKRWVLSSLRVYPLVQRYFCRLTSCMSPPLFFRLLRPIRVPTWGSKRRDTGWEPEDLSASDGAGVGSPNFRRTEEKKGVGPLVLTLLVLSRTPHISLWARERDWGPDLAPRARTDTSHEEGGSPDCPPRGSPRREGSRCPGPLGTRSGTTAARRRDPSPRPSGTSPPFRGHSCGDRSLPPRPTHPHGSTDIHRGIPWNRCESDVPPDAV